MRNEVRALAERTVEGRGAREARCSAAPRSGPPYLSWAAGRGSLLPEEPPALSPAPPARRPRGFVYRLDLFSEAPAAPALLAVAQLLADGNLKPRCGAEAPTVPSAPGPSASLPARKRRSCCGSSARPGARGNCAESPCSSRPGEVRGGLGPGGVWIAAERGWGERRHPASLPRAVTVEPRGSELPCGSRPGTAQPGAG